LYLNEIRKNLAAPGKLLLPSPRSAYFWCSTTYIPVGDLDRSPLIHSYCYASVDDQSILFAIFPLTNSSGTNLNSFADPKGEGQEARSNFVPFMQYEG
jgi:hypothetical protein